MLPLPLPLDVCRSYVGRRLINWFPVKNLTFTEGELKDAVWAMDNSIIPDAVQVCGPHCPFHAWRRALHPPGLRCHVRPRVLVCTRAPPVRAQGLPAASPSECNCRCASVTNCVGYTWLGNNQTCWLLHQVRAGSPALTLGAHADSFGWR